MHYALVAGRKPGGLTYPPRESLFQNFTAFVGTNEFHPIAGTGTVFTRMYAVPHGGDNEYFPTFGTSNQTSIAGGADLSTSVMFRGEPGETRDPGTLGPDEMFLSVRDDGTARAAIGQQEVWYNVWQVIDTNRQTYDVYMTLGFDDAADPANRVSEHLMPPSATTPKGSSRRSASTTAEDGATRGA